MPEMVAGPLAPLEPWRNHYLYPRASAEVLMTKRREGYTAAVKHAERIATALEDQALERTLT